MEAEKPTERLLGNSKHGTAKVPVEWKHRGVHIDDYRRIGDSEQVERAGEVGL